MTNATERLAILNCDNINMIFDVLAEVTDEFVIKRCTSRSGKIVHVIEASVTNNIKFYDMLNNLKIEEVFLDCRFVDINYDWCIIEEVTRLQIENKPETSLQKCNTTKKIENDDTGFKLNLYDDRFMDLYENEHFNLDASHEDYKKCGYLKFFVNAKREYDNQQK